MKLNELFLKKCILQKLHIRLQSNQFFSTLGSIIEISGNFNGIQLASNTDDSI